MKIAFLITIFAFLYVSANAWVAIIPPDPKTANLGYCYSKEYNIGSMTKGETKKVKNECIRASCLNNKSIDLAGCGVMAVEPPCQLLPGDVSKPYPDCCFEIKCPKDNQI